MQETQACLQMKARCTGCTFYRGVLGSARNWTEVLHKSRVPFVCSEDLEASGVYEQVGIQGQAEHPPSHTKQIDRHCCVGHAIQESIYESLCSKSHCSW